ncbi:MAG: SRPBCC domain-containing protein [Phenylobacterium sp.]
MIEDIETIIEIEAPRPRVWAAMTGPATVEAWLGSLQFRPAPGHVFYMQPDAARRATGDIAGATHCRIEHLEPPRRLVFTWDYPEAPTTSVAIRLSLITGGTHVRLTHSGWSQFKGPQIQFIRDGLAEGWSEVALPSLRRLVEAGG